MSSKGTPPGRPFDGVPRSVEERFARLRGRPHLQQLLAELEPPPRFAAKRFSTYAPAHPTQAEASHRLLQISKTLRERSVAPWRAIFPRLRTSRLSWLYLDGGFGVGKTHLLAALWNDAPDPKVFLTFDELVFLIGIAGAEPLGASLSEHTLVAVDEWELDDPGNLKMALSFLRRIGRGRALVAVTSNTLPLELGAGRFSQKDFRAEIEELAGTFQVIRIEGEDYRHRHYETDPGRDYLSNPEGLERVYQLGPDRTLELRLSECLELLRSVHPIRYRELARSVEGVRLTEVTTVAALPDALRFVHFIDAVYNSGAAMAASGDIGLGELFDREALAGPYAKKLSRCLSRLEEMLGRAAGGSTAEARTSVERRPTAELLDL